MKPKSIQLAENFLHYCQQNPSQRFWQALRNWACVGYILTSQHATIHLPQGKFMDEVKDTFYWESKHE
jgi:hypothetical protein